MGPRKTKKNPSWSSSDNAVAALASAAASAAALVVTTAITVVTTMAAAEAAADAAAVPAAPGKAGKCPKEQQTKSLNPPSNLALLCHSSDMVPILSGHGGQL